MLELIRYDIVDEFHTCQKKETSLNMVFKNHKEMENFKKKLMLEYPNHNIYLTYKEIPKTESNG